MNVFRVIFIVFWSIPLLCVVGLILAIYSTIRKARANKNWGWRTIAPLLLFILLIVACIIALAKGLRT